MASDTPFDWWETPDPQDPGFVIEAGDPTPQSAEHCLIPAFLDEVVTWAQCPIWVRHAAGVPPNLQGYRLVHIQKAGKMKRHWFFARIRTPKERLKQIGQSSWRKQPFHWHSVLKKLYAQASLLPLSTADGEGNIHSTENWQTKIRLKPGGTFPTWFRTRHFLSEKPWPRASAQRVPIPDAIHWQLDGLEGGLPSVLHPGVVVENNNIGGAIKDGFGTLDQDHGAEFVQQSYPPTNMIDWMSYVVEDERQSVIGKLMELRIVVDVYPPDEVRKEILSFV